MVRNDGYCITSGEHDDTPGVINPSGRRWFLLVLYFLTNPRVHRKLEHLPKAEAKVGFFGPTTKTLDILGRCATDALICQCIEIFYGYVSFIQSTAAGAKESENCEPVALLKRVGFRNAVAVLWDCGSRCAW